MLSIIMGVIGGAMVARMFILFKRISKSSNPERVIMELVITLLAAATLPFMVALLDK